MQIESFVMERWQSTYEHNVEINLSDSGVSPLTIGELLDTQDPSELLDHRLIYTQSNGTPILRDLIAGMYPGATREHVEVTNGGAEANLLSAWTLIEPGDEVVLQLPNYMQLWGVLRSLGADVKPWSLMPDLDAGCWHADIERLESMVTPETKTDRTMQPKTIPQARFSAKRILTVLPRWLNETTPGSSSTRSITAQNSMGQPLPRCGGATTVWF